MLLSAIACFRCAVRLRLDRRAVTAIEYGLIAALIALIIITGVRAMGTNLVVIFNKVSSELG